MLIHLEKLGKSFGEKVVLHDVSASVEKEDRIGIVGQNGAGKTNKPNFKRVSVKIIGESASRRLQLSRGDIDIADALPVDQLNALKQENKVNVAEYPSLRVHFCFIYYNHRNKQNKNLSTQQFLV